jgi:hypothetical protein
MVILSIFLCLFLQQYSIFSSIVCSELFLVFHYVYIAFVWYNFSVLGKFTCEKILPPMVFHDLW